MSKLLVAILKLFPQMLANHIGGAMVGMIYCGRSLVQIRLVKIYLISLDQNKKVCFFIY